MLLNLNLVCASNLFTFNTLISAAQKYSIRINVFTFYNDIYLFESRNVIKNDTMIQMREAKEIHTLLSVVFYFAKKILGYSSFDNFDKLI